MRWIVIALFGVLIGCGAPDNGGGATATTSFADAQAVVDGVAAKHADLKRLTLHAIPTGKTDCTQVASTMESRRGKPSDPEDLEAMETGKEVILDEDGAVDVTVPILMKDGKATAVAGVTVEMKEGADRDARVDAARAIAKELEKDIQAAGKALW